MITETFHDWLNDRESQIYYLRAFCEKLRSDFPGADVRSWYGDKRKCYINVSYKSEILISNSFNRAELCWFVQDFLIKIRDRQRSGNIYV